MKINNKFLKLSLVFLLANITLVAQERNLEELIDIAMKHSVNIQVAKADIEVKMQV